MHRCHDLGRVLAVSPHLDDGVFSCGELLAAHPNAVVVTVFAGVPDAEDQSTGWDTDCGFASAHQAVISRRAEDRAALELLQANPYWLDFCDSQYRRAYDIDDIADALRRAVDAHQPDTILIPFGLFHSDHQLAHEAAVRLFPHEASRLWLAYEDALYRTIPGLLQQRLRKLADAGIAATPTTCDADAGESKQRAVNCYASQLRGLATSGRPGHSDILTPERYWYLTLTQPQKRERPWKTPLHEYRL
jgi:LmbE family N-acetylglucosaminyl deacetylase